MHSLLAKTRVHHCGCRACSRVAQVVGRRATTKAHGRKVTFAEIFTACYSSLFATAAVVDTIRKSDRRQELDRQIQEAKLAVADLAAAESSANSANDASSAKSRELDIHQMHLLWRALESIDEHRPSLNEIRYPVTLSPCGVIRKVRNQHYRCVDGTSLDDLRRTDYSEIERVLLDEEIDSNITLRAPSSKIQLLESSTNVERLIRRLLWRAKYVDDCECQKNPTPPSPSYEDAWSLIEQGYPNYEPPSTNPNERTQILRMQNENYKRLIESPHLSVKEKVGRICHNLLVSPQVPDIRTYNSMMVAFGKAGHEKFAHAFWYNFLYQSKLSPSPSTFTVIFHHHKNEGRPDAFFQALRCVIGTEPRIGAKLRRRHVLDCKTDSWVQRWSSDTRRVNQTGKWIFERYPLNRLLIESIIQSFLRFNLFSQAALFFSECLKASVTLSVRIVKQVFEESILSLDWSAAVHLIKGLVLSRKQWIQFVDAADEATQAHLADRVFVLLEMCGLRTPGHGPSNALIHNLGLSKSDLAKLLRHLECLSQHSPSPELVQSQAFQVPGAVEQVEAVQERSSFAILPSEAMTRLAMQASRSRLLQYESLRKEVDYVRRSTNSITVKLLKRPWSLDAVVHTASYLNSATMEETFQCIQDFQCLAASQPDKSSSLLSLLHSCDLFVSFFKGIEPGSVADSVKLWKRLEREKQLNSDLHNDAGKLEDLKEPRRRRESSHRPLRDREAKELPSISQGLLTTTQELSVASEEHFSRPIRLPTTSAELHASPVNLLMRTRRPPSISGRLPGPPVRLSESRQDMWPPSARRLQLGRGI